MAELTLTQQMGAMSIVDALRAEHQALEDHLGIDQQRKVLSQRIQDYYRARGQAVEQSLVDEGVRLYFDRRLRFMPVSLRGPVGWMARAYIEGRLFKRLTISTLVVLALSLTPFAAHEFEAWQQHRFEAQAATLEQDLRRQAEELNSDAQRLEAIKQNEIHYFTVPFQSLITRIDSLLSSMQSQMLSLQDESASWQRPESLGQAQESYKRLQDSLLNLNSLFQQAEAWPDVDRLAKTSYERDQVLRDKVSQLAQRWTEISLQFSQPDLTPLAARTALNEYDQVALLVSALPALQASVEDLYKQGVSTGALGSDLAALSTLKANATDAIATLNKARIDHAMSALKEAVLLLSAPLELRIVSRTGVKSGVERTYSGSGGKAWYLVVEAVDAAGVPHAISVTNAETGKVETVSLFAVSVTLNRYEEAKRDKMDDGHVDNARLGLKPKGKLQFAYESQVTGKLITHW